MTISHLHSVAPAAEPIDLARAKDAARDLLLALGCDLDDESVRDTPRRVAETYAELLSPSPFNATTFPNDEGYDELVVARDIPFHSLCEHHLLPFMGVAHVAYLPGERIIGLSVPPRRLPAGGGEHRPVEARPGGRSLRPPPAGAGAADEADRQLARGRALA